MISIKIDLKNVDCITNFILLINLRILCSFYSIILSRLLGIGHIRNNPDGRATQTGRYEHTDTKLDLVYYNICFKQQSWTFSDSRRIQDGRQRYSNWRKLGCSKIWNEHKRIVLEIFYCYYRLVIFLLRDSHLYHYFDCSGTRRLICHTEY